MLLILGTIRLPAGKLSEAKPAMAAMIAGSRAEAGCLAYAFAEDVLDPGLIHITEGWKDRAAFESHVASAHMKVWRAAGASLGIADRNLKIYEAGDPKPL